MQTELTRENVRTSAAKKTLVVPKARQARSRWLHLAWREKLQVAAEAAARAKHVVCQGRPHGEGETGTPSQVQPVKEEVKCVGGPQSRSACAYAFEYACTLARGSRPVPLTVSSVQTPILDVTKSLDLLHLVPQCCQARPAL